MNPAPFDLNVPPGIHDGDAIVPDTKSNCSASEADSCQSTQGASVAATSRVVPDGAWVGEPVGELVGALVGVPALASGIGPGVG